MSLRDVTGIHFLSRANNGSAYRIRAQRAYIVFASYAFLSEARMRRTCAKAMYRMGILTFGAETIPDLFGFGRQIAMLRNNM